MMMSGRYSKGFTLVEVLVALGIFAMMSSGFLVASQKASQQLSMLEEKTFALWLAQDRLAEIRQLQISASEATGRNQIENANRDWVVQTKIEKTPIKEMVKIIVTVSLKQESDFPVTQLEGYFFQGAS